MRTTVRLIILAIALLSLSSAPMTAQQAVTPPEQFFGFKIGADGELARYPKILEYFQLLAKPTDRVKYEEIGKTTMGNIVCAAADQLAAEPGEVRSARRDQPAPRRSARRCRTPRRRSWPPKASRSICSTPRFTRPRSRTARRSSTSSIASPPRTRRMIREILDNSVVLMVPSQNPDGQHLVIDHWYKTKGTQLQPRLSRTCITSTSATTTTATGSCSRRKKRA